MPQATVTVAPIRVDDQQAGYVAEQGASRNVTDYRVENRYEEDPHRYMLGITAPEGFNGDAAAFVQLAAPTLLWIADWTAAKWGSVPQIPSPIAGDPDWILLARSHQLASPVFPANGTTPLYRISGTYVYGKRRPADDVTENLVFPRPPWMTPNINRKVGVEKLTRGIIDLGTGTFQLKAT